MKIRQTISKRQYILLGISGIFFIGLIWSILSYSKIVTPIFLPSPTRVLQASFILFKDNLLYDIFISSLRVVIGFLISAAIAIPLGIIIGTQKRAEAFIEPTISFVRYIPPSAFIPLSILWFGIEEAEKYFVIFIGVAPYLFFFVAEAVAHVRQEFVDAGLTLGANNKRIYIKIIIPSSLPRIWEALQLMFSVAWSYIIFAEIIAVSSGLGSVLIKSQRFLKTDKVIAVVIIIGLLGLLTDFLFRVLYKRLFPWSEKKR